MSESHRFYLERSLQPGERAELSVGEAHHALNVLRLPSGTAVELFDGCGWVATGQLVQGRRSQAIVEVQQVLPTARRLAPPVELAFAVPKAKRLDWLLEKATELAAASLRPVIFERSVAGGEELSPSKRQRWIGHCVAAAKQSGLNLLPQIHEPVPLRQLVQQPGHAQLRLLGSGDHASVPVLASLDQAVPPQGVVILVGPEGGLTSAEQELAVCAGFVPVRLGWTTLRIETAAIALLAACQAVLTNRH